MFKLLFKGGICLVLLVSFCLAVLSLIHHFSDSSILLRININSLHIVMLLVLQSLLFLLASDTWRVIVISVAKVEIDLSFATEQTGLMYISKYIPGKLWGIVIRSLISKRYGLTPESTLQASVIEQIFTLSVASILGCFLILAPVNLTLVILLIACVCISTMLINLFLLYSRSFIQLVGRLGVNRFVGIEIFRLQGFKILILVIRFVFQWVLIAVIAFVCLDILSITPSFETFVKIAGALALSVTLGFLAIFSPGGLGVREGVLVYLLEPVLGLQNSLVFAVTMRLWNTQFDVFASVTAGLVFFFSRGRKK